MTDIYFIGCHRKHASHIRSNALLMNEDSGPDPQYCYWQIKPIHGDMDLYSIEDQWSHLGNPEIPGKDQQFMIECMQTAARYRYHLYELLKVLLQLGEQPHFIINDLETCEGDWAKFSVPEPISLKTLLDIESYHLDHWYVVTGE